jgi:hypothetical protein
MTNRFIKGAVVTAALATATIGLAVAPAQAATATLHCTPNVAAHNWGEGCTGSNEQLVAAPYAVFMAKCKDQGGNSEYSWGPTPNNPRYGQWSFYVVCTKPGGFH